MLLEVSDELDDNDVAGGRQGAIWEEKAEVADGSNRKVRTETGFSVDDASLSTCEAETTFILMSEGPSFLDHKCTLAPLAKLAQSILK